MGVWHTSIYNPACVRGAARMEEQLHIALISTHFAPEVTPITHLYADLAEDFCRYGARVSVVTKLRDTN